jgi:putative methyltransferase (TIGR04325 family)
MKRSGLKSLVRECLPPAALRLARGLLQPRTYSGDYAAWAEARAQARGYDDPAIFEKAVAATRAVRDGQAAFERDTVLFAEPAVHGPLLAGLLRAAALNGGRLQVIDFGGAFGSAWWQHRAWLEGLAEITWEVVEQAHFTTAGRREFEIGPLRFRDSLDACRAEPGRALLLLSSVLPYLEAPHALTADCARRGYRHVLIDRTGFVRGRGDRLTVQRVPPSIYDASYPCWFFEREKLLRPFADDYRVVAEWETFEAPDPAGEFRGLLLERVAR